jgi:hypothetical protein
LLDAVPVAVGKRPVEAKHQAVVAERLAQEANRPCFQPAGANLLLGKGRDEAA